MNTAEQDEFIDQYEEAGETKTLRSAGIRLRNPTHQAVRMMIQASPPIPRVVEKGPWTPETCYTFDVASGRLVRVVHRAGEPYPQIVIPTGAEIVVSKELYHAIHQTLCEADGCTLGARCRNLAHSPKRIIQGLGTALEVVPRGDGTIQAPMVHPGLVPQPPAPPPAEALDDLLLQQVMGGAA